jgi:hypothetical protein
MDNKVYFGIEIEGISDLDLPTVFVPRGTSKYLGADRLAKYIDFICRQHFCKRIYLGAKEKRGLDYEDLHLVKLLLDISKEYVFLAEIDDPKNIQDILLYCAKNTQYLLSSAVIKYIYVVKAKAFLPFSHIKFESIDTVRWYELDDPGFTSLNDKRYQQDIEYVLNENT